MRTINILFVETDSDWLIILKSEIVNALTNIGFSSNDINFLSVDNLVKAYNLMEHESFELVIINILIGTILVQKAYNAEFPTIVLIPPDFGINNTRDLLMNYQVCSVFINIQEEFELEKFINTIKKIFENKQVISHPSDELSEEDRKYLIDKLAALASTAINPADFFEELVYSLDLPQHWRNELTGFSTKNPNYYAHKLIGWCEIRYYPNSSNKSGEKVLAYLVKELLNRGGDDDRLKKIMWKYGLI